MNLKRKKGCAHAQRIPEEEEEEEEEGEEEEEEAEEEQEEGGRRRRTRGKPLLSVLLRPVSRNPRNRLGTASPDLNMSFNSYGRSLIFKPGGLLLLGSIQGLCGASSVYQPPVYSILHDT